VYRPVFHILLLFAAALLFTACLDTPPTHHRDSTIHLEVVNEGTFSVRLNVSVKDSSDVWTFRLNRDDSTVAVISSLRADTTVQEGGLLPGHTYHYRAYWLDGGEATDSSEEVTATTMDTTSHNFIWEIDTLGNYGSYLNDVAIVSEDNIWVVGYITTDTATYNAANWNGIEWGLIRLPAITYSGYISQGALTSIYAINADEIWCSSDAGSYVKWNGQEWESEWIPDRNGGINAVWGTSSSNMYFVCDNGSIVHYNGTSFEKMETLMYQGDIVDVIFDINGWNEHVFLLGKRSSDWTYIAFEFKEGNWEPFYTSDDYYVDPDDSLNFGKPVGIDIYQDTVYMATGFFQGLSSLIKYNYNTGAIRTVDLVPYYLHTYFWVTDLVVTNPNDIIVLSKDGKYLHYNGVSWIMKTDLHNQYTAYPEYYRIKKSGNRVVIGGYKTGHSAGLSIIGYQY